MMMMMMLMFLPHTGFYISLSILYTYIAASCCLWDFDFWALGHERPQSPLSWRREGESFRQLRDEQREDTSCSPFADIFLPFSFSMSFGPNKNSSKQQLELLGAEIKNFFQPILVLSKKKSPSPSSFMKRMPGFGRRVATHNTWDFRWREGRLRLRPLFWC